MIAKVGLGLLGLSAIGVGGVVITKPYLLGMDYMPEWHSLSEDNGYPSSDYESDKFGKKYGKYLVGVTNKKGTSTDKTNKAWWEWAYRRLSKDKDNSKSKKFKQGEHVTGGFITTGDNTDKSLHKVCGEAYKKGDGDFHTGGGDNNDNKFTKDEVWKYCSPGKLTTTSEDEKKYEEAKIGGENTNKTVLISVKNSANDWFWEIRNKDFLEASGDWSGSKATSTSSFKTAYDNRNNSGTARKTIKKLCEDAYELTKNGNGNTNEDTDAKKFCKLEA